MLLLALVNGIIAGLRAIIAPATIAWSTAVGIDQVAPLIGLALRIVGAVVCTPSGGWARARFNAAFGRNTPAVSIEDAVAIGGASVATYAV